MDRYGARQTSTTFADDPTESSATSVPPSTEFDTNTDPAHHQPIADCLDKAPRPQSSSFLPKNDASTALNTAAGNRISFGNSNSRHHSGSGGTGACGLGVTEGCRSCIDAGCKEQKRVYFLRQKCPLCMAWTKIAGDAPSTMATFEEHAAQSLRSSSSVADLQSSASRSTYTEGGERRGATRSQRSRVERAAGSRRAAPLWTESSDARESEEARGAPATTTTTTVCVLPPPRFGHTAVLYKTAHIVVFGGKANDEHYYNDVYAYAVEERRWVRWQEEYTEDEAGASRGTAGASPLPTSSTSAFSSSRTNGTASVSATASTTARFCLGGASSPAASMTPHESREGSAARRPNPSPREQPQPHDEDELHTTSRTEVLAPATDIAATQRFLRPCGRVGHAAALYQDTMYILSGERQGKYFDDMWALDIPSLTWAKECGLPFSPRKGHTMHLLPAECTATRAREDMFVVFGGLVKASRVHTRPADPELPTRVAGEPDMMCAPTNETLLYYPAQRRWCQLKTCGDVPTPRFYHVAQLVTGTSLLLLFGGRTVAPSPVGTTPAARDGSFMNDLHMLDVSTGMWRQIRDVAGDVPSPRMCAASVFVNGTFAVFAGGGDGYCRNAYEYQLGANRWRRLTPNDQPACSRPTVTYVKDRLVFFGGFAPRIGVMNCTMELCLAPLSLTNQCLLWWNRCAFEKHVRTRTQNRLMEQEQEKTAAATATMRVCCRKGGGTAVGSGCCGKQVTLHRNPANLSCSPVPTPRQSMINRGTRRPSSFQAPGYDRATPWNMSTISQGLWYDVSPSSPSLPYAPSSPVMCSPLSSVPQSIPSWHESTTTTTATTNGSGSNAGGTLYCASYATTSSPYQVSPRSTSASTSVTGMAVATTARPLNVFPSRPDPSLTALSCTTSRSRSVRGGVTTQCSGPQDAPYSYSSNYTGLTDTMQRGSAHPSSSVVTPVSLNSLPATSRAPMSAIRVPPQESTADGGCRIANCMRTITGFVVASFPRFKICQPPPSVQQGHSSTDPCPNSSPISQACTYSPPPSLQMRSPANSQSFSHPLSIDVAARSPPSPQAAEGNSLNNNYTGNGFPPRSPVAHSATAASSMLASPLLLLQRQTSLRFTESASSRASSVHSVRSASSETVRLSHVKQLIRQLEGPTGPFLFRAMAARVQQQESD